MHGAVEESCLGNEHAPSRVDLDRGDRYLEDVAGHGQGHGGEEDVLVLVDDRIAATGAIDIGHRLGIGEVTSRLAQGAQGRVEIGAAGQSALIGVYQQPRRALADRLQSQGLVFGERFGGAHAVRDNDRLGQVDVAGVGDGAAEHLIVIVACQQGVDGLGVDLFESADLAFRDAVCGGLDEEHIETDEPHAVIAEQQHDVGVLVARPILITSLCLDALQIDVNRPQTGTHRRRPENRVAHVEAPVVGDQLGALVDQREGEQENQHAHNGTQCELDNPFLFFRFGGHDSGGIYKKRRGRARRPLLIT